LDQRWADADNWGSQDEDPAIAVNAMIDQQDLATVGMNEYFHGVVITESEPQFDELQQALVEHVNFLWKNKRLQWLKPFGSCLKYSAEATVRGIRSMI
jgi:hypothetical protein